MNGGCYDEHDESLINTMSVINTSILTTDVRQGNDTITDLGQGANINGLLGSDGGYDMGIEIGTQGIGKNGDDVRSYSFTLKSTSRPLTLNDFSNVDFGVRLTSVGVEGGDRSGSSKIGETTFHVVTPVADSAEVCENDPALHGNIFANDPSLTPGDTREVVGIDGHPLANPMILTNAEGATLTIYANGDYILDASGADKLSEGKILNYVFNINILQHSDTDSATSSSTLTIHVCGVNDGPLAYNDDLVCHTTGGDCIKEGDLFSSGAFSVLGNDMDIDRLDTKSVVAVNGVRDGGANDLDHIANGIIVADIGQGIVTMRADGTFDYDQNHTLDYLNTGDMATVVFNYTMSDNHGAESSANVSLCVDGEGVIDPPPPPPVDFPEFEKNSLSNVVFYLDNIDLAGNSTLYKLKFDDASGQTIKNLDDLGLVQWINDHAVALNGNTHILAYTVHGGQEFPNDWDSDLPGNTVSQILLHPGEGVFFLNDGNTVADGNAIIDLHDNGASSALYQMGITAPVLAAGPNETHQIIDGLLPGIVII